MPQPESLAPPPSAEDSYLEVLAETLEGLEESARGQFLRQFFRTIARIDLSDAQANEYWEQNSNPSPRAGRKHRKEDFAEDGDGRRPGFDEFPARSHPDGVRRIQEASN